tara:strand:- start:458 stop:1468 length:1011 start_codon:yes stop_codon:yes gene_type:complete
MIKNEFKIKFLKPWRNNNSRNQEPRFESSQIWSRRLLWSIISTVSLGFIYSSIVRIDEVVTAIGELQAEGAERPINSPIGGTINSINVNEGQRVKNGEILIKLDSSIYQAQIQGLRLNVENLYESLKISQNVLDIYETLFKEGAISKVDYLEKKIAVQNIKLKINQANSKIEEIKAMNDRTRLSSPVDGVVFNLIPSSKGYAVTEGEVLLKIVPDGDLEAKVFLTNKDVGFLTPKMKAEIRVDAFPFTQFGSIKGKLKLIGEEVLPADQQNSQSRFPVIVSLDKQYLSMNKKKFDVKSGQSVTVNFVVRKKRLITLLTDTIDKAFDALRGIKSDRK